MIEDLTLHGSFVTGVCFLDVDFPFEYWLSKNTYLFEDPDGGQKFDVSAQGGDKQKQLPILPVSERVMLVSQIDHYMKKRSERMDFMMMVGEQEQFELL